MEGFCLNVSVKGKRLASGPSRDKATLSASGRAGCWELSGRLAGEPAGKPQTTAQTGHLTFDDDSDDDDDNGVGDDGLYS